MSESSKPAVTSSEVPLAEKRVLIVEDETVFARAVQKRLNRGGFNAEIADSLAAAESLIRKNTPDLILLDMRLPDGSGLDLLGIIKDKLHLHMPVLVISAYGEIEDAVSAMKRGAADYLKKPVDLDELMINVEKVLFRDQISQKLVYSTKREKNATEDVTFLGDCPAIENIKKQLRRLNELTASADTVPPTILILGETGTGKDVVARILHGNSSRSNRPFVHVDCASLPKDLIEAELFGHEKGAFTSAHVSRTGLIEAAEDGVLFMDEIGELPMDLQAKLLAVLERRTVRKVGTTRERPVAAWIIAATNRDIEQLSREGKFRSDLFYRLNVLTITMPALRDRGNDVLVLAEHFCKLNASRYNIVTPHISAEAKSVIMRYHWPGNVRELKHMIERAVLVCAGEELHSEHLSLPSANGVAPELAENVTLDIAEATLIKQALAKTNGNVSKAARELGITRMALRYRIKKHCIDTGE